jgi:hypothetical protein
MVFGSKVTVGVFGKAVAGIAAVEVGVSPPEEGWKGVNVGVAFGGTVTRNRVVGVAKGSVASGAFPQETAQPATMKMISTVIRNVRLIKSGFKLKD